MARTLNQVVATLPIERRASELATLKDLRQASKEPRKSLQ